MQYSYFNAQSVRRGSSHGADVGKVYSNHPKLKIFQRGLIVNPDLSYLGSSPDGLLYCKHCKNQKLREGVLEIPIQMEIYDSNTGRK